MTTRIMNLTIKSQFVGTKTALFDTGKDNTISRHHRITVDNAKNGKSIAFDYYPSLAHPYVDSMTDILSALSCFLLDADSGEMALDDFVSEFGYDSSVLPISKILKIYDACHDAHCKLDFLFEDDDTTLDYLRAEIERKGL